MTVPEGLAQIWLTFDSITIPNPRMAGVHRDYNALREFKRLAPRSPQKYMTLLAPTQSGKSTTIRHYLETVIVDEAIERGLFSPSTDRQEIVDRQRLAIHVTLAARATPKSLASDILKAFRDPYAATGTTEALLGRVYDYTRAHGTELVFIDEIQHLAAERRGRQIGETAVTKTLRRMMDTGLVPLVFVGLKEAEAHLEGDVCVPPRCLRKLDFQPLSFRQTESRTVFTEFVGRFAARLQKLKFFDGWKLLLESDIPACLHAVAGGRLGMVTNLLRVACEVAFEEGSDRITREHLAIATESWAIPMKAINYNPFDEGLRDMKVT